MGWMRNERLIEEEQAQLCKKVECGFVPAPFDLTLGISRNFDPTHLPLNGLRSIPVFPTTGWYIWSGEDFSDDVNFFDALHVEHLMERAPSLLRFLGLRPGWRFLKAGEYEDVWFDSGLIQPLS